MMTSRESGGSFKQLSVERLNLMNNICNVTDEMILSTKRVKTQMAAEYLGIPVRNLQEGMQLGVFPFATAYKKNEWVYMIFPERLVRYKHGYDMVQSDALSA